MKKSLLVLCISIALAQTAHANEAITSNESPGAAAAKSAYQKAVADQAEIQKKRAAQHALEQAKYEEFSKQADAEAAQAEAAEAAREKVCGADFNELRVGMPLARANQCYGEFHLHGQTNSQFGTVDHYTRGGTWILIQKGKIVAWGDK